jgi:hypothetical protein
MLLCLFFYAKLICYYEKIKERNVYYALLERYPKTS